MPEYEYRINREFLKDSLRKRTDFSRTDQNMGHVCQNLYLACEAIGGGTCAVAAYDQEAMDELLGLDGYDELSIYLAPVGRALSK